MTTQTEPELVTTDPATAAVVRDVVPMAAIRDFFDASFQALAKTIAAQGVAVTGPAFGRYRDVADGATAVGGDIDIGIDIEVGFTTDRAVRPDGVVRAGDLPGVRVARLVHAGPFDGLGSSWERLRSWIEEQGLTPAADRWEVYVTQPSPDTDPLTLRTELNWPVAG